MENLIFTCSNGVDCIHRNNAWNATLFWCDGKIATGMMAGALTATPVLVGRDA